MCTTQGSYWDVPDKTTIMIIVRARQHGCNLRAALLWHGRKQDLQNRVHDVCALGWIGGLGGGGIHVNSLEGVDLWLCTYRQHKCIPSICSFVVVLICLLPSLYVRWLRCFVLTLGICFETHIS